MTKEREALKLALEALNEWRVEWSPDFYEEKYNSDEPEENTRRTLVKNAITAAEEALAQQAVTQGHEQEPVAWPHKFGCRANAFGKCNMGCTTPPQRKPLTDEQVKAILYSRDAITGLAVARLVEAAHGIMSDTDGKE